MFHAKEDSHIMHATSRTFIKIYSTDNKHIKTQITENPIYIYILNYYFSKNKNILNGHIFPVVVFTSFTL